MTLQEAIYAAALTRQAYWNAMGELEEILGFHDGNVPDAVDTYLYDAVGDLALGNAKGQVGVSEADVQRIVAEVRDKTPRDWHDGDD